MENRLVKTGILLFISIFLHGGCSDDLDYSGLVQPQSSADERFTQSYLDGWQKFPAEINVESDSYCVLVAADCHVGETANLAKLLVKAKKPGITALFLAGDVSTGKEEDYKTLKETLENSPGVQYYLIVGNHDLFYDGWKTFFSFFGSSTYFVVIHTTIASDLFICLDTGGATLGEKQLRWLKNLLEGERHHYRKCIVITHNNFFRSHMTDSTNPMIEEVCELLEIFTGNDVNLVISGHDHSRSEDRLGPVTFLTLDGFYDGLENASYLKLDVSGGNLEYDFICP